MGQGLAEWKKKFWSERESKTEVSSYWLRDSLFESHHSAFDAGGSLREYDDEGNFVTPKKGKLKASRDYFAMAKYLRAIGNFVHILTQDKSISVMYNRKGVNATDGKVVHISPKINEDKFDVSVGLALHEASHILYTDFDAFITWLQKTSTKVLNAYGIDGSYLVKSVFNIVEDRYIDAMTYKAAPGYRGYYSALYQEFFGDKEIISGLWSEDFAEPTLENYLFHIVNITSPARNLKALPGLDKIYTILDLENILKLTKPVERMRLAEQIIDIVLSELQNAQTLTSMSAGGTPTPGGSPSAGGGTPGGTTAGTGSDDDEDDEEDDKEDDSTAGGTGEDEEGEEDDTDPQERPVFKLNPNQKKKVDRLFNKQKDLLNNTEKVRSGEISQSESDFVNSIANADISIEDVNDSELDVHTKTYVINHVDPNMVNTELGQMFGVGTQYKGHEADPSTVKAVNRGIAGGRILANRLKLRTEDRVLTSTRLKSGKIDRRLLHEVGFDNFDIFHKINIDSYNSSYVHISIDQSGSMSGTKWDRAIEMAAMIATASTIVKNIRVVVTIRADFSGFRGRGRDSFDHTGPKNTYGGGNPYIAVVFDSKRDNISQIRSVFPWLRVTGSTPEGLSYAAIIDDVVRESQNTDAYFINICDGEPTYSNGKEHTKKMRTRMESHGIKILAYFVEDARMGFRSGNAMVVPSSFSYMFGDKNSVAIPSVNITQIANTMNRKLLEK